MLTIEVLNAVECRIETKYKQVIKPCLSFTSEYWKQIPFKKERIDFPSEYWKKGPFKKERIEYTKDVFYLNSKGYSYFQTGLIPRVITYLNNKGVPYQIEREKSFNETKLLAPFLPGITFRQDQLELIHTIHIPKNNFRGVIVSPTGSGKTIIQLGIISTFPENFTVLILAHTLSLIEQTYQELLKYNFKNVQPITGLTSKELTGRIVVSTIQSFSKIDPDEYMDYFDIVICDECFAKETKISTKDKEKSIEQIIKGEIILSKDGYNKVTNIFINKIILDRILKITLSSGKTIFCSKDHLFLDSDFNWIKSINTLNKNLVSKDEIFYNFSMMDATILKGTKNELLSCLQKRVYSSVEKTKILFTNLCSPRHKLERKIIRKEEKNKFKRFQNNFRKDEEKQSIPQSINYRKDKTNKENKWNFACLERRTWWKWKTNRTPKNISSCTWLAHRSWNYYWSRARRYLSNLLQSGYWKSKSENCHRSGWENAQVEEDYRKRQKENNEIERIRVESVEVYKPGDNDKSFSSIIGDKERNQGFVEFYDLEVENSHSYVVEGVVVHNCHHTKSGTYSDVLKYLLAPVRMGFTATMPKNKEHLLTIEGLIGPLIGELTIDQAKEIDILAKPKINIIKTTLDWNIKREKNYHRVYETGIVSNIGRNRRIINLAQKYAKENKSTLIMVSKIEHGNNLLNMAKTSGLDIEFVNGDMKNDEREQIKKRITNKELLCIICTTVWKEGINIPSLDTIINAAGGRSEIATLQTIGRGLRKTKDKDIVNIVDFFDPSSPFLVEHFGERLCLYYEMGWL